MVKLYADEVSGSLLTSKSCCTRTHEWVKNSITLIAP